MSFKNLARELRGIMDSIGGRGRSHIAPEGSASSPSIESVDQTIWESLPPELLLDTVQRIESCQTSWPARKDVVACASVCRSWREITKEVVKTPELGGLITFPISLKQPGPRDAPIQCFIKRERGTAIFRLYLGLSPALSGDMTKLLLAAKKVKRTTKTEFLISLVVDDFSRTSINYVGKLRSNFLGNKFTIYDSQPPCDRELLNTISNKKFRSRQESRWVSATNYKIASISYKLTVLRTRGPRKMNCVMHSIPISSVQEGGSAPTPMEFIRSHDHHRSFLSPHLNLPKPKSLIGFCSCTFDESSSRSSSHHGSTRPLVLRNKAPRWHEQLQCWCLNFRGRVTVASVKNFQLVAAAADPSQNVTPVEQETVILQFGKIGKDIFTMDYRYPLSAFQAFAICLSSFDTKPACE